VLWPGRALLTPLGWPLSGQARVPRGAVSARRTEKVDRSSALPTEHGTSGWWVFASVEQKESFYCLQGFALHLKAIQAFLSYLNWDHNCTELSPIKIKAVFLIAATSTSASIDSKAESTHSTAVWTLSFLCANADQKGK